MAVSSENLMTRFFGLTLLHSFVYRVKRTGELTQPWGAPVLRVLGSDRVPLTLTLYVRLVKKE